MGRKPHIIVKNRVKELFDGRTQIWLVQEIEKKKRASLINNVFSIVNNKKNLSKTEVKMLTDIFGVTEDELYNKPKNNK